MSEIKLLPCPFCGGEVAIALNGDNVEQWYSITRGFGENKCTCRLFMESEKFDAKCLLGTRERVKNDLAKAWNTRKPVERILTRLEKERHPEICGGWETMRIDRGIEIIKEEM